MLKAKWILIPFGPYSSWFATVGPHQMLVAAYETHATASIKTSGVLVWGVEAPAPYDHQTVMLQAEQELSRRLAAAAETLNNEELAAPNADDSYDSGRSRPFFRTPDEFCDAPKLPVRTARVAAQPQPPRCSSIGCDGAREPGEHRCSTCIEEISAYRREWARESTQPSRKCSHEGCTTPPLPDSWMCCNHDNQVASGYRRDER